jgi:uncharacterized protein YkwD
MGRSPAPNVRDQFQISSDMPDSFGREGRDEVAVYLSISLRLALLSLTFVASACAARAKLSEVTPTASVKAIAAPDLDQVAKLLVDGTNGLREKEGRRAVITNQQLASAAQGFAEFMARTDKYGHDTDGKQPADRAKARGYEYCIISENIAYQYNSAGFETEDLARTLLEGWKKSEGHRKNMLDPDVLEAGMGVARSEKSGKYYAVQMFGRPKSAMIEFSIANETVTPVDYELAGEKYTVPARTSRTHGQCRSDALKFTWKDNEGSSATFHPAKGDRFVIRREQSKLSVSKGKSEQPEEK